jgi:PAS domain S-box-containing protein
MVLFLTRFLQKVTSYRGKVSLQTVLVVPFVLQIFTAVGLTGYLSFRNGQEAVNDIAAQLLSEISLRVEQNLQTFLETPHLINQSNADDINLGALDVENFAALEKHFFYQSKIFKKVSLIGFANNNQEFISTEKLDDGSLTIRVSGKSTNYNLRTYATNNQGKRVIIRDFGKPYDTRRRNWYNKPIQTKAPVWSEVYPHNSGIALYIASSQSVYNQEGNLQGVLLSNLNLQKIGDFLEQLKIGKTGTSFIIERPSGTLVATSTNEKPFRVNSAVAKLPENKIQSFLATSSNDLKTQATAKYLETKFGNLSSIKSQQQLEFKVNGKRQFIQVLPFKDNKGIDWLIVVVIPEDDFMEKINVNTRTTIILCVIALMVATAFGILVVRWITQPILALKKSATALAKGEWEKTLEINRSDELGELAKSFNDMTYQLQASFSEMETLNKALLGSESRLKQFLEAVPVGVSIHDITGQIYYANRTAKQFLGIEVLLKANSEELTEVYQIYQAGENQLYPTLQLPIVRSLAGETVEVDDIQLHQANKIIPIKVFSTPIFDENGKIVYAIAAFIDITERKQAEAVLANYNQILQRQVTERTLELEREIAERKQVEETLREQKEILQVIFDRIPIMICFSNHKNEIQFVNPEYERVMGWKNEELKNVNIEYLLAECFSSSKERALAEENMLAEEEKWLDLNIKVRDGSYLDTSWIKIQLMNGEIIGIGQDITNRKLAAQASVLEERNRMAREIHDTLMQTFTGISIHLGGALQVISVDGKAAQEHITLARELSRTGLAEARASVQGLRSPFFKNSDLRNAFNQLVTQISLITISQINYTVQGIAYFLPLEVENQLLRIGQEALSNAVKHAKANVIQIELAYEKKQCVLRVQDDGQGFAIDNMNLGNSFGILGMRERSTRIGAELTINSKPGQGTNVMVSYKSCIISSD